MSKSSINLAIKLADFNSGVNGKKMKSYDELVRWNYAYRKACESVETIELIFIVFTFISLLFLAAWVAW